MIRDLSMALLMRERLRVSEVVVSERVFEEVLSARRAEFSVEPLALNRPQSGFGPRYVHRAGYRGMTFIYLSNAPIIETVHSL